jgi:hypothetical protein|tara:strand:- start:354 stop:578 length:225 start_codon:yes stop_codon:yes gene_type:complete
MDTLTHTIIAVGLLATSYYLGAYLKSKTVFDDIARRMLDKLEKDGFIATKTDEDGEKELVTISEVLAKALKKST